jgi:beta-lactam-binding protein with PASTA domain
MSVLRYALLGLSCAAGSASAQENFTVPDVRFMQVPEAKAVMKAAGFAGNFEEDQSSLCASVVDGRIVELGEVCHQVPYAGMPFRRRGTVSLRVQREDPRHGHVGQRLEWHLMPKLTGMTEAEALAAMLAAGFSVRDRIRVQHVADFNCEPARVCRSRPDALMRAGQHEDKLIVVGK